MGILAISGVRALIIIYYYSQYLYTAAMQDSCGLVHMSDSSEITDPQHVCTGGNGDSKLVIEECCGEQETGCVTAQCPQTQNCRSECNIKRPHDCFNVMKDSIDDMCYGLSDDEIVTLKIKCTSGSKAINEYDCHASPAGKNEAKDISPAVIGAIAAVVAVVVVITVIVIIVAIWCKRKRKSCKDSEQHNSPRVSRANNYVSANENGTVGVIANGSSKPTSNYDTIQPAEGEYQELTPDAEIKRDPSLPVTNPTVMQENTYYESSGDIENQQKASSNSARMSERGDVNIGDVLSNEKLKSSQKQGTSEVVQMVENSSYYSSSDVKKGVDEPIKMVENNNYASSSVEQGKSEVTEMLENDAYNSDDINKESPPNINLPKNNSGEEIIDGNSRQTSSRTNPEPYEEAIPASRDPNNVVVMDEKKEAPDYTYTYAHFAEEGRQRSPHKPNQGQAETNM